MAWWVVAGHISLGLGWNLPLVDRNVLAVDVFILLSGFVIAMLVERKAEPYPAYLIRRAFRLFPLYLPVLAISAVLLPVQLMAWESLGETRANLNRISLAQDALAHFPAHLAAHIPLLQGFVPTRVSETIAYTIVGQSWSISLEWQFYLVAPLLIAAMISRRWAIAGVMMIVLLLLTPFFSPAFLGAKILLFGVGIATQLALKPERRWRGGALIAALLCGAVAVAKDGPLQVIPLGIWTLVILASVSPAHSWRHIPARLLGSPIPFHMGEISYSIYLLHMIPLYALIYACHVAQISGGMAQIVIAAGTVILTYLGAVVTYHMIEKPGIRLGAWLTRPRGGSVPRS